MVIRYTRKGQANTNERQRRLSRQIRKVPLWARAPIWVTVVKDVLCFITGLGGMVYLMWTNSSNIILILAALSLIGLPGASAVLALVTGQQPAQTPPNSQAPITGPSSASPLPPSSS